MPPETAKPIPDAGAPAPATARITDLEIKDAQIIFGSVWQGLEAEFGRENLRFPKEILLLGGAPGAGKGTNTRFIGKARGLTRSEEHTSELQSPCNLVWRLLVEKK